jgi:hypothetical protein
LECPHQRAKFQTLSDKTALNPPTSFQQLTGVSQNVIEHTWQKLGDVVNCKMLPMVAEARERDRTARMQLGLELINWETRS